MRGAILQLLTGSFSLIITAVNLTANKNLKIKGDYVSGNIPQIDTDGETLKWITPGSLGGGTVSELVLDSSVTPIFNVSTATTTPTLSLDNQAINLVFASPSSGGAGVPTFRSLVSADIPNLDAAKISSGTFDISRIPVGTAAGTVAAGNDSRLHVQNTDTGTSATSFQLNSGASGVRVKDNAGALEIRNAADNAYGDLVIRNLVVQGTTTTINTETVTIADNIFVLNSDYTGSTPTENGGIEVERGTLANAAFLWDESTDRWKGGLVGSEYTFARIRELTFTSANVTAGIVTINHNLANSKIQFTCYESTGQIFYPLINTPATDSNNLSLNIGSLTITGTATVVIIG